MLYYLFEHLDKLGIAGAGVFKYISFRASLAGILSLLLALIAGKSIIGWLQRQQIGETIRELGLEGQMQKKGTPTMGGIIIILSIIIPTLLLARLDNIYVVVMIISTIWMGVIGGIDDYIKVFKKDKEGMKATTKLIGQLMLGAIIAVTIDHTHSVNHLELTTNLPITKNILNYTELIPGAHNAWIIYIPIIIFIVMAVTNAVNLTDGIDGLAAGTTAIVGVGLGILAYAAGNIKVSEYLNIIYVPNSGEVVIFLAAVIGACLGFLWYNGYPAQVFMGDTGSMALGGAVAAVAIIIKMELLLPILCGVFLAESGSVILQVSYFKYTKKRFGEGKRIFLMSPLHHHFQKKNIPESKITIRFWLITIVLVLATLALIKLR
ncbi:MAG: phospho-N-acetylmuramoyl-pentapeptide-transferase [Bacteroidota bacterium]|jgi:phospho-N-acetylmuramoyl-pentapeptide-transferase|nr:phospho-N-acetylmuramoyl-pentapeptide-transferase [Bacteroidota bacterium]NBX63986.1 phospho-N-acetylmuramoyl-pentapeptide-transferase [Bacteroidota bacterium]